MPSPFALPDPDPDYVGRPLARRGACRRRPPGPKTVIATWADSHGADAILMGTHGWTGRAHSLVGSVAESTVRAARCPVMVIHSEWTVLQPA